MPLRNRDEIDQSRFRSQQVVVTRVAPQLTHVVADHQQTRRLVVQEAILHARELAGLQDQPFDLRHPLFGAVAGGREAASKFMQPLAFRGCRSTRKELLLDDRQDSRFEACQFAQRRDCTDTGVVAESARRSRQQ